MKTELFDFELPPERIATIPANPRDSSRMLVVAGDDLQDKQVADLLDFLRAGDVMVFNDTKVIPARLMGKRGEVKIEVLLHKKLSSSLREGVADEAIHIRKKQDWIASPIVVRNDAEVWQCFVKPAKRLKIADVIVFADDFSAKVLEKLDDGQVVLEFSSPSDCHPALDAGSRGKTTDVNCSPRPPRKAGVTSNLEDNKTFWQKLEKYGAMPLPPYIERVRVASAGDNETYQTVYARASGSVAAPTAGLHFTYELLKKIDEIGVKRVSVTLHVGGGTFLPVKVEDTKDHIMHSEFAEISAQAAEAINAAKRAGGRVIAVGTTSVRTLESVAGDDGILRAFAGETNIFITPSYRFKIVDMMLTNFHLPKSTLFMLVSAFAGLPQMKAAYDHAIRQKYRFYSYGDACLLMKLPLVN